MKKIIPLLALVLACPPLAAQVDYDGTYPWSQTTSVAPDSAVPGWFYNLGITGLRVQLDPNAPRTLVVKHVFANTPAAAAGIQVNDVITGVEGHSFTEDHQDGYGQAVFGAQGPIGEFGIALDDAQGVDGLLGVTLTRGANTLNVTLDVGQVYGSYSPTFPLNCPKSDLILSELLAYLRQTQNGNGAWGGEGGHENHIFAGLALLSDGSPASMTAAGNLAAYYNNQTNGPIPADGLNNWKYLAASIYLAEYYHKTSEPWVLTKLNTLYSYLLASQYTDVSQIVPGAFGSDPTIFGFGGWGHNPGFEGYGPICMTTGQGALALALMDRVGVNVDRTRLDAAFEFLVEGTGANSYVWYADSQGGGPTDWADPGRTGAAAIANWMSPYTDAAYATRAIGHARFMGDHPQSFPDTHGSPTIGMAYAAMGTQFDPASFRKLLDDNRWWFSLAHTPEGNFYYQPNRDNAGYGAAPRFVASSVTALILSLPKRNLLISERVVPSDAGHVVNGTFQMFKPGTDYTVTASFADGDSFARGVGDGIVLAGGTVNYSDGTTGTTVDLPGWTPVQSGNDLVANGVNGSTGMNLFAAWGGDGRIQSASSLGSVQEDGVYTISVMVGGPDDGPIQGPLAFHLLADGVQLTPTSSVNPTLPTGGAFQEISRTYEGAALAGHIGKSLTVILGVEDANDFGNRVIFDNFAIEGIGSLQASFASAPAAISPTAISMTATTGTSAYGPVEYLFTETSNNPGGTSSGWQTSPNYTDSGLTAATQYTYTVTMRDALGNTGTASAPASATTQGDQPLDLMSLNFYAYGGYAPANHQTVTLEAGESAGVGAFNVSGWQNFEVPFGLDSPMAPVTLTSNLGATATLTLNDVRNGWTYSDSPHTNFPGGNGDLMNGHCNGTEDPYDGSNFFDMVVTDIPYQVYDLIVYVGSNAAQFGNGSGKLVLNGGAVQDFTLPPGEFSGFVEITNAVTPGNYIIFRGLRNPSLTLKVWGNGFNHIGPSGFQIVKDGSGVIPPGPAANPDPPDASVGHASGTDLSWTGGLDAVSRNVYFGTNPTPGAGELQGNQTASTFDPGTLANGTYYWRIDEVNSDGTTTGPVWSFAVGSPAKAFRPMPWDGMSSVALDAGTLKWVAGESATASSSDVYFGTDATPDAGEFVGNQSGAAFNPGLLSAGTTYYWRVDQVNAQGTTTGDVWSFTTPNTSPNKVKIFIMAGQSNMEGQGEMNPAGTPGTLQTIYNNDPVTYAHLKSGGNWAVRDDTWIWYKREGTTLFHGGLTAGYGANSTTIGPELQFGHAMGDFYGQKVLLIKTAWGGKSLRTDFRPPGSGWSRDVPVTDGDEGFYFKQMLDAVVDATANLQTYFPTHNPADGFEIAGFAWHQGWNDRVTPAFAAEYEVNMAEFIRDVRCSVGVPRLPFVIATTGMDGNPDYSEVELAQLQMENFATYPEFDGNVAAIDTQGFWFPPASSPADQGYHWNRNAGSYYQIGESIAREMQTLIETGGGDNDPPTPDPMSFAVPPAAPTGEVDPLSILDAATLAGNNPATGAPWQPGDSYRLAFVSSATTQATSTDISTYNAFVQGVANAAGLGAATWKVIGSTATVDARDNTGTNPGGGAGVAVYLTDGSTPFASGNNDLWNGANVVLNRDQNGNVLNDDRIFTGSEANGTRAADSAQVLGGSSGSVQTGRSDITGNNWMRDYNVAASEPQQVFALSDPITLATAGDPFTQITMTATTATDASGVEYHFDETSGNPGGSDSGWQDSPVYTDTGLQPGETYTYTVTARDKGANHNTTAPSVAMSATTAYTSAFTTWAAGPFPSGQSLDDSDPGLDFDGGSLPTGTEWVLGGDPTDGSDDASIAPTIDNTNPDGKLRFIFRRTTAAKNDTNTTIAAQYGNNLSGWTNAVHQGTGPTEITITEMPDNPGLEIVTVALPANLADGGKLFARLNVAINVAINVE
jgi:hypothetical protein